MLFSTIINVYTAVILFVISHRQTVGQHLTRIMIIIINPDFFVVAYEHIIAIHIQTDIMKEQHIV